MSLEEKIELIKGSSSKEILNGGSHQGVPLLKYVFEVHEAVFGIACKSCSDLMPTYIAKIQNLNLNQEEIMSKAERKYRLKSGSVIRIAGTNTYISDLNLTDEVAVELLKVNPNRSALFAKMPKGAVEKLAKVVAAEEKEAARIEKERIEAEEAAADQAQKEAEEKEAQRLAEEAAKAPEVKNLEVVTNRDDSKPTEKSDEELTFTALRAKYPHVTARSKEEFLRELNA